MIGCDEVGRACLAGPVVASAVILNPNTLHARLNGRLWFHRVRDSKLVPEQERELLSPLIQRHSVAFGIGIVEREIIDAINIHHATLLAMRQAVEQVLSAVACESAVLCVDGKFPVPGLRIMQEAVVDADAKILSVAAASIVAKTYRDGVMRQLHVKYPAYGFDRHKGYPTRYHREAIKKFGLTEMHRLSFCAQYS